jgi:hypothetical protein
MTRIMPRAAVIIGSLLVASCAAPQRSVSTAPPTHHPSAWAGQSAVYCSSRKHAPTRIFAGRLESDGSLTFGLSIWAGNNIALYGTATPDGQGWQFTQGPIEDIPDLKCKVRIVMDATGAPTVTGDPEANCLDLGGAGMIIRTEKFQKRDYEGPVTFELEDQSAFWTGAGKCAGDGDKR